MKLTTRHYVGIALGITIIIANFLFFLGQNIFYFVLGIAAVVIALPFLASSMIEVGREKEAEEMFLEFSRNLVESVKAGTPISKSIINVRGKDYGSLTVNINKLANQIALGIPLKQAFFTFAKDVNNKVITRSIALITEAEQSGGKIDTILESVAKNVAEVEYIKKERKTAMYNMIVELYIIFFIFLIIMIVLQNKLIPQLTKTMMVAGTGSFGGVGIGGMAGEGTQQQSIEMMNKIFLALIIVQGFFAGLVTGKLAEGNLKAGLKHSAIIVAIAYLLTTGVKAFM